MEISVKWLYALLAIAVVALGYFVWYAIDIRRNTNYTLRSGWEAYDIRSIIERTPTHLKAIGANGEPIEIHGQYTLIGPYGDKR